ncbi:hypothetical protein CIPAW_01G153200 [Carya illinoinensis]|uniref:Uncharacterized protein n=1 Tax=Carya illinoinensis TaxID=32201 RepID=A0A8T1RQ59_CARIL|nr:hypothetical protein CIPAW_01G153200 [Carya illinoinensis]
MGRNRALCIDLQKSHFFTESNIQRFLLSVGFHHNQCQPFKLPSGIIFSVEIFNWVGMEWKIGAARKTNRQKQEVLLGEIKSTCFYVVEPISLMVYFLTWQAVIGGMLFYVY